MSVSRGASASSNAESEDQLRSVSSRLMCTNVLEEVFAVPARLAGTRKGEKDVRGPLGTSPIPGTKVVCRSPAEDAAEILSKELFIVRDVTDCNE